jgi:putative membrane protein
MKMCAACIKLVPEQIRGRWSRGLEQFFCSGATKIFVLLNLSVMRKIQLLLFAAMLVTVACDDDDQNDPVSNLSESDKMFVTNAADGGMFEVRAGELAAAKGDSTSIGFMHGDSLSVKSFGRMMITDHTKVNEELKDLATRKGASVPTSLTAPKQQKLDSLSAVSGEAFNQMYAKMMVSSHQETVTLFQAQSASGNDSELKSWASEKLSALQEHLHMAQMLADSVRK